MMITDNIFGKRREYEPSRKPVIREYDIQELKLDPELRKIKHVLLNPKVDDNREYCFWVSSIAQSFAYITSSVIIGDGLRIRCKNQRAKRIIEDFNDEINVNGKSIEDYITSSWIDEIIHGKSFWRIIDTKETATGIDIQRVDSKTLTRVKDDHYGWIGYLQKVPNYKGYRTKRAFYSSLEVAYKERFAYPTRWKYVRIPDEPDVLLSTNFFAKPPIAPAIQYISYKKLILFFMRKYSRKLWTPFLLFLIGDPKTNYYPESPQEMQDVIDQIAELIPDIVTFGGASIPGNIRVEEIGKGSAKESLAFIEYMNFLDKQIMMATFGSMSLREASGVELATSKTQMEQYLYFIKGIRRKYRVCLERFYTKALLPANGIKLTPRDIEVEYSPLKLEGSQEIMNSIEIGVRNGMFLDRNEIRKAGQVVWNWLEEKESNNIPINKIASLESTLQKMQGTVK